MASSRMRSRIAKLLAGALLATGVPMAQVQAAVAGEVSGHAVDAIGRPLANADVEIFEAAGGQPVGRSLHAARTDRGGAWAFQRMAPGDYVVRLTAGRQQIGVPVSLGPEESIAGLTIVAPAAAALQAEPAATPGSPLAGDIMAIGIAAAVAAGAAVTSFVLRDAS